MNHEKNLNHFILKSPNHSLYVKLAGFTDSKRLSRMKEAIIAVIEVDLKNFQTIFQFLILV